MAADTGLDGATPAMITVADRDARTTDPSTAIVRMLLLGTASPGPLSIARSRRTVMFGGYQHAPSAGTVANSEVRAGALGFDLCGQRCSRGASRLDRSIERDVRSWIEPAK